VEKRIEGSKEESETLAHGKERTSKGNNEGEEGDVESVGVKWQRSMGGDRVCKNPFAMKERCGTVIDEGGEKHESKKELMEAFTKYNLITEEAEEPEEVQRQVRKKPSTETMTRIHRALRKTRNDSAAGPDGVKSSTADVSKTWNRSIKIPGIYLLHIFHSSASMSINFSVRSRPLPGYGRVVNASYVSPSLV